MDYEISEKVFQVKAKPIGDLHLKDVEFEVIVYICPENVAVIKKEDMIKNDDDSYYGLITTEIAKQIGVGNVKGINVNGKEYNAAAGAHRHHS